MIEVADGNPGALSIVYELGKIEHGFPLLSWLSTQGIIGSLLWRIVKEDYHHNWVQFRTDQLYQLKQVTRQDIQACRLTTRISSPCGT